MANGLCVKKTMMLKKWLCAAPIVAMLGVIGCGGLNAGEGGTATGGTNATGGGNGGLTSGPSVGPSFNFTNVGEVQVAFLTGQGRAVGSLIAVIRNIEFSDSLGRVPNLDQQAYPPLRLQLDGYTYNSRTFTVDVPSTQETRFFDSFPFEIYGLEEITNEEGATRPLTNQVPALIYRSILSDLRVFPGRQVSLQMFLDDDMIGFDGSNATFDADSFTAKNYSNGKVGSFFSDFAHFDISEMADADRPTMFNGSKAKYVLFSGDSIAVANAYGVEGGFELLQPIRATSGTINLPSLIGNDPTVQGGKSPGSYSLFQTDPRDLDGIAKLTSLNGTWRSINDLVNNLPEWMFLTMPTSNDIDTDADITNEQQVVLFQQKGGKVVKMWQGKLTFSDSNGDGVQDTGSFSVWPISQVVDATASNQVDGTVSNLLVRADSSTSGKLNVFGGNYTITIGAPAGAPASGRFYVFRR